MARSVLGWLAVGAVVSLVLATVRGFVPDQPVPYSRQLDLREDLTWLSQSMPAEIASALALPGVEFSWRSDGRRMVESRFGEESRAYTFWRYGPDGRPDRTPAGTARAMRVRRGWPLACVEGSLWTAGSMTEPRARRMVQLGSNANPIWLPYGVLPLELLVDAVFWGGFFQLILLLPLAVERLMRRRRGLCPGCAYPLRGLPRCPECGLER